MEFTLVQAGRGWPDTHAAVHQFFHPIGASAGEQISAVRLRRTENGDHAGQCRVVTARMSMGSVASQMATMRIIGRGCR